MKTRKFFKSGPKGLFALLLITAVLAACLSFEAREKTRPSVPQAEALVAMPEIVTEKAVASDQSPATVNDNSVCQKDDTPLSFLFGEPRQSLRPCPFMGPVKPRIAIIIDDMGLETKASRRALEMLPPEITFAFIPYTPRLQELVNAAREAGHDVLIHMPMEAEGGAVSGRGTLKTGMGEEELRQQIDRNLDSFYGYYGVNNHMGSAFTADAGAMRIFLEQIAKRGLFFVDSRTTAKTKGEELAREMGIPVIRRHVFLDHQVSEKNIKTEYQRLLAYARQHGYGVAIGHPHTMTLDFLIKNLPYLTNDFDLVPVRRLIEDKSG